MASSNIGHIDEEKRKIEGSKTGFKKRTHSGHWKNSVSGFTFLASLKHVLFIFCVSDTPKTALFYLKTDLIVVSVFILVAVSVSFSILVKRVWIYKKIWASISIKNLMINISLLFKAIRQWMTKYVIWSGSRPFPFTFGLHIDYN